jgi:Domain of unknown function (DUF4412)
MLVHPRLWLLVAAAVPMAQPGSTQAFQGVVTLRTIRTQAASLTEDEQPSPDKVLAVPLEQILAKGRAGELTLETETMVFELRGSKVRSSSTAPSGLAEMYGIGDLQTGVFRFISPSQRIYTEWTREDLNKMMADTKKMAAAGDSSAAPPAETATLKLEPLGATKTIAGFHCTGYRYSRGTTVGIAWLTKDLADVTSAFLRMSEFTPGGDSKGRANPLAPFARLGFPCLTQQLETEAAGGGHDYEVTELVSVDRRAPADDRFSVPAGYRKMTFPQ